MHGAGPLSFSYERKDADPAGGKSRLKYMLCTYGRQPVEIDIYDYRDPFDDVFLTYYIRVFRHLEETTSIKDLTVYFVWDAKIVPDLPTYGDNVVAVLLQDEAATIPHYLNRVRFVFKAYGFRPHLGSALYNTNIPSVLKCLKDLLTWSRHSAAFLLRNGFGHLRKNGLAIPLGYARQTDLPAKPFASRRYTVSFIGSLENGTAARSGFRSIFSTPKNVARSDMVASLRSLSARMSNQVWLSTTRSFRDSIHTDGISYSEMMADTKICLAPRGSSVETYRFFEGLRQGCIVICDRLPSHWFYEGCPAIQLRNWRTLDAVVTALVADPERMAALHRASRDWWETRCSEQAVAGVLAHHLGGAGEFAVEGRPVRPQASGAAS